MLTEVASDRPVRANFGRVIRNGSGYYLLGFSDFIQGSPDILLAELFSIYEGLILAKNMVMYELICYSDSLHRINLIKGLNIKYHVYVELIQYIKKLFSQSNITLCHTLRKENNYPNFLAKLRVFLNYDLTIHTSRPKECFNFLKSDTIETLFLRE
jgi:hypothetical protein